MYKNPIEIQIIVRKFWRAGFERQTMDFVEVVEMLEPLTREMDDGIQRFLCRLRIHDHY